MFVVDDILLSPIKLLAWLGNKINEVAEKELSDEGPIKERLMELQMQLELGKINKTEYDKQEKELLARLDAILKAKEEGGNG